MELYQGEADVAKIGVLVMAYGGPDRLDDVEPYLLDVRHNRPTAPTMVAEIRQRYEKIGGRSPILERTRAQADALQRALDPLGVRFRTAVGMRHWQPRIESALELFESEGIRHAVGLVMAPHYSRMSIGAYYEKVAEADSPVLVAPIEEWHLLPGYLDALVERILEGLGRFPADDRGEVTLLFTAHSLPERIQQWQDPYPAQLKATTAAVMRRLGPRPFRFAYQSAAMTPDPWLGPDAGTVLVELADSGSRQVLIIPIGFTCEHVEVLYDVDVEFQRIAEQVGTRLERIEMLNDAKPMMTGLADLVRLRAKQEGWL